MFKIMTKSTIQIHFVNNNIDQELKNLIVTNFYNMYSENIKEDRNIDLTKEAPFILDSILTSELEPNFGKYYDNMIKKQYLLFALANLFLEKFFVEVYFSGHYESHSYFDGSEWMPDGDFCRVEKLPTPKRINIINSVFCHENEPMTFVSEVKKMFKKHIDKNH